MGHLLNVFISIKDFFCGDHVKFLSYHSFQLYLPTSVVVDQPTHVVPKIARVFRTDFYDVDGRILTYDALKALPDFKGCGMYESVYLYEVWQDEGCDGWVNMSHIGYMFCSDLGVDKLYPTNKMDGKYMDWRFSIKGLKEDQNA